MTPNKKQKRLHGVELERKRQLPGRPRDWTCFPREQANKYSSGPTTKGRKSSIARRLQDYHNDRERAQAKSTSGNTAPIAGSADRPHRETIDAECVKMRTTPTAIKAKMSVVTTLCRLYHGRLFCPDAAAPCFAFEYSTNSSNMIGPGTRRTTIDRKDRARNQKCDYWLDLLRKRKMAQDLLETQTTLTKHRLKPRRKEILTSVFGQRAGRKNRRTGRLSAETYNPCIHKSWGRQCVRGMNDTLKFWVDG